MYSTPLAGSATSRPRPGNDEHRKRTLHYALHCAQLRTLRRHIERRIRASSREALSRLPSRRIVQVGRIIATIRFLDALRCRCVRNAARLSQKNARVSLPGDRGARSAHFFPRSSRRHNTARSRLHPPVALIDTPDAKFAPERVPDRRNSQLIAERPRTRPTEPRAPDCHGGRTFAPNIGGRANSKFRAI